MPATRPPTRLPAENDASARPPSSREPCASANAGIASSTEPKPTPTVAA